jgi:hypothetical protein
MQRPCNNQCMIIKCNDHTPIKLKRPQRPCMRRPRNNQINFMITMTTWRLRWPRNNQINYDLTWPWPWSWLKRQQMTRYDRKQSTFIRWSFWFWRKRQSYCLPSGLNTRSVLTVKLMTSQRQPPMRANCSVLKVLEVDKDKERPRPCSHDPWPDRSAQSLLERQR